MKKASSISFWPPYTTQQNGVAERKNRTLIEMARTMLHKYKTSDWFWAEAVNMACHASNRLYIHKLLKKTPYELLTSNTPNISYFRVFGSKCYILQKRSKSSKFAPTVYEGFILGYDSNSHAYRVFNNDSGCVETTCDTVFDETNGSQVKQYDLDIIDDEEAPCDALQRMVIGEVRPQDLSEQQVVAPNDTTPLAQDHDQDDEDEKEEDQEDKNEDEQDQPHDEDKDHDQEKSNDQEGAKDDGVQERSKERPPHPKVRHTVQRDHPVDNILGDIKKG
jgi:hypothetical protein